MMERIVLICPDGEIEPEMLNHVLPFNYQKLSFVETVQTQPQAQETVQTESVTPEAPLQSTPTVMTKSSLQDMEKEAIIQALIDHHGIQTKAGKQLGMTARQIGYKIKKYGIDL
jgi:Nif-specific regulatory protein